MNNNNYLRAVLALFLLFSLCFFFCAKKDNANNPEFAIRQEPLQIQSPRILMVYDSTDKYGLMALEQARWAFNYGKIPYDSLDVMSGPDLSLIFKYPTVALTMEKLWQLNQNSVKQIKEFVANGGGLVVLFRGWNVGLAALFGVTNNSEPKIIEYTQSARFVSEFLPGSKNLAISNGEFSNYAFYLGPNTTEIVKTDKWPLAWINRFGKGKVIYWNSSLLCQKENRGFITRSISVVQPYTIVSIANAGIFCLDDYPNSSTNHKQEPIKSEFDETDSGFYVLRWYPDMLKIAEKYNLKYTAALIFNYNATKNPPYRFYEWLHGKIRLGGKEIYSSIWAAQNISFENTELGLHGYNHYSLHKENWVTKENMNLALGSAVKRWELDNLGDLPVTYIPPHNQYDAMGAQAISESWPSIKIISGLYFGDFEQGGNREFGPEPWNKALYCIPRNTSGYIMTEFIQRSLISLLISNGIWSHFVHPDDVFPTGERYDQEMLNEYGISQLRWYGEPEKDGLYYQQMRMLDFVKKYFPWLRFLTAKEAYNVLRMYDQTQIGYQVNGETMQVETNVFPAYFVLYSQTSKKFSSISGGKIIFSESTEFGSYAVCLARDFRMTIGLADF